jgi:hypothetical protein
MNAYRLWRHCSQADGPMPGMYVALPCMHHLNISASFASATDSTPMTTEKSAAQQCSECVDSTTKIVIFWRPIACALQRKADQSAAHQGVRDMDDFHALGCHVPRDVLDCMRVGFDQPFRRSAKSSQHKICGRSCGRNTG